jgi:thioredoxin-like negative regulator of GroEL
MSRVIEVDEHTFDGEVLQCARPVLVEFCIIDCAASESMLAALEGLAKEVEGRVKFSRVDIAANPGLAAQYAITTPSFLVFQHGQVINRTVDLSSDKSRAERDRHPRGLWRQLLGFGGLKRTGSHRSRSGAEREMVAVIRYSAVVLLGLGGTIVGMMSGWEFGPVSLELGRDCLTWVGAASGCLLTVAATCYATERSEARTRNRRQIEFLRNLVGAETAKVYRTLLLKEGPDAEVCFNLANVLHGLGETQAAIERLHEAVTIDPQFSDAWNNLGNLLADKNCLDEALDAFLQAVMVEPDYADAHFGLAHVLEQVGRRDEARVHWHAYLQNKQSGEYAEYARSRLATQTA